MSVRLTDRERRRVAARPLVTQWDRCELMTLAEAVAVCMPDGPLTVRSLRTARAAGQLATCTIAGKIFTTVQAVETISATRPLDPDKPPARRNRQTSSCGRQEGGTMAYRTRVHAALMEAVAPGPRRRPA